MATKGIPLKSWEAKKKRRISVRTRDSSSETNRLDCVTSAIGLHSSGNVYPFAIDYFVPWFCSEPRLTFNKTVVPSYRLELKTGSLRGHRHRYWPAQSGTRQLRAYRKHPELNVRAWRRASPPGERCDAMIEETDNGAHQRVRSGLG